MIKHKLKKFEAKGLCGKKPFIRRLVPHFMEKARHNILLCNAVWDLSNTEEAKKILKLPEDFSAFDWVMITAYYSMYHSALAALASVGYKSDNHTATIIALEVHFVRTNLLEREFLDKLKRARGLEETYIHKLRRARRQRETAQYRVTEETGKEAARALLKDAGHFVNRMGRLVDELNKTAR